VFGRFEATSAFGGDRDFASRWLQVTPSLVLEQRVQYVTSRNTVGVIEHHGPIVITAREQIGASTSTSSLKSRNCANIALSSSLRKVRRILKSTMASVYVRQLLLQEVKANQPSVSAIDTLKELFYTFFPGKEFVGSSD